MGWGIDATISIAHQVSALPGDVWTMPRMPIVGLIAIVLGGSWICLWRGPWRRWGLAAILAGFASMMLTRLPDIVIADGGRFLAVRAADGHYLVAADKNEKIVRSLFAEETSAVLDPWPRAPSPDALLDCAGPSCRYRAGSQNVAIVTGEKGVPGKCDGLDAIVAQVPAGFRCRYMIPVVDRIDVWRRGAVAFWLDPGRIVVEAPTRAAATAPGSRTRGRNLRRLEGAADFRR
jgi:competence protein ComEC